jgi:hypothetical protein
MASMLPLLMPPKTEEELIAEELERRRLAAQGAAPAPLVRRAPAGGSIGLSYLGQIPGRLPSLRDQLMQSLLGAGESIEQGAQTYRRGRGASYTPMMQALRGRDPNTVLEPAPAAMKPQSRAPVQPGDKAAARPPGPSPAGPAAPPGEWTPETRYQAWDPNNGVVLLEGTPGEKAGPPTKDIVQGAKKGSKKNPYTNEDLKTAGRGFGATGKMSGFGKTWEGTGGGLSTFAEDPAIAAFKALNMQSMEQQLNDPYGIEEMKARFAADPTNPLLQAKTAEVTKGLSELLKAKAARLAAAKSDEERKLITEEMDNTIYSFKETAQYELDMIERMRGSGGGGRRERPY